MGNSDRRGRPYCAVDPPRTHYFAQTRSVCTVAAARCAQIFDLPGSVTLWRLTDTIEDRLDVLWESWLDNAESWRPFFERVAGLKSTNVPLSLQEFGLITDEEVSAMRGIKNRSTAARYNYLNCSMEGRRRSRCSRSHSRQDHREILWSRMCGQRTHEAPSAMVPTVAAERRSRTGDL